MVIITIYIDDLIIAVDSNVEVENIKSLLQPKFEMKDLGELRCFLGIQAMRMHEVTWM